MVILIDLGDLVPEGLAKVFDRAQMARIIKGQRKSSPLPPQWNGDWHSPLTLPYWHISTPAEPHPWQDNVMLCSLSSISGE